MLMLSPVLLMVIVLVEIDQANTVTDYSSAKFNFPHKTGEKLD